VEIVVICCTDVAAICAEVEDLFDVVKHSG